MNLSAEVSFPFRKMVVIRCKTKNDISEKSLFFKQGSQFHNIQCQIHFLNIVQGFTIKQNSQNVQYLNCEKQQLFDEVNEVLKMKYLMCVKRA